MFHMIMTMFSTAQHIYISLTKVLHLHPRGTCTYVPRTWVVIHGFTRIGTRIAFFSDLTNFESLVRRRARSARVVNILVNARRVRTCEITLQLIRSSTRAYYMGKYTMPGMPAAVCHARARDRSPDPNTQNKISEF